jgi:hypothetical protein
VAEEPKPLAPSTPTVGAKVAAATVGAPPRRSSPSIVAQGSRPGQTAQFAAHLPKPAPVDPPTRVASPPPPAATRAQTSPTAASTQALSPDEQFPLRDRLTAGGRKKSDSRHPLEISEAQQIGRFGVIREIARGGMGQVFLARDTKLGRKVAIKFLLHDDPAFVARFLVEARATARCTHENIITIFEVGEHNGLPFMVLEYLEGKTFSELLAVQPTPRQFAELMLPVARALERADEHGIVHRDLKPSNIFVTDRGAVKVLDFGVAKCFDTPELALDKLSDVNDFASLSEGDSGFNYVTFSGTGTVVGTLPYMSPEQWGSDVVDHQSDLWALGIMFWRALARVHPAGTMKAEKMKERLTDFSVPLPSLGSRDPTIPAELVAIVDRLLAKPKAERYPSATQLIADLQAFLAPRADRIAEDVCPYRGLAAFAEGDAKFFFGRSAEIRTALGQLDSWPLLAVIGPSGVGKSSFVHAGLVPAIRTLGGWRIRIVRPGRAPLQSLASLLAEEPEELAAIVAALPESPGVFGEALRREAARKQHKIMLVVDQLEELFTLSANEVVRGQFLAALLAAADDPSAPVRVVLSMRADFLDRLAGHKHFLGELSRGLFFLSAPDHDNLRETLVRPAELAGYAFEDPAIVEDMMQTATSRGALPLLQFAATRLWDARDRATKRLTRAAYEAMGGVGGAFARHADEVAASVPAHNQALLRAIMTRLVTVEGTRAVVDHRELLGLSHDEGEVERILDQLVRARLIHLHTGENGAGATVEIVHEVLITEWPTLQRWLDDSQALRGFMHELRVATRQWTARGRAADLVWRGETAREALATADKHVLELSTTERAFLDAARVEIKRGRSRKVLAFVAAFGVLVLIIAGGAVSMVKIWAAESVAQEQAVAADKEATRARAAEAQAASELAKVKEEEKRRAEAEAERQKALAAATQANAAVQMSREQLESANAELQTALDTSQKDRLLALEAAKAQAAAAALATKATAEAKAANARTQTLLAAEKERVKQLELQQSKIATGGLK